MSAEVPASPVAQKPVRQQILSDEAKRKKAELRKAGRLREKLEVIELKKSGDFTAEMDQKEIEKKTKVLEANKRFRESGKLAVRSGTGSEKRRRQNSDYNHSGRLFGSILQIDAGIEDGIDRLVANENAIELMELEGGGLAFVGQDGVVIEGVEAPQSLPASPEIVGLKRIRLDPSPGTRRKRNDIKKERAKVSQRFLPFLTIYSHLIFISIYS